MTATHEPERCGARLTDGSGRTCRHEAGWGTGTNVGPCKLHGGSTRNGRKHAERVLAERAVADAVKRFDLELVDVAGNPVGPAEALLADVTRTARLVAFFAARVQALTDDEMVTGVKEIRETRDGDGAVGRQTVTGPGLNVWLTALHRWQRHLVEVCRVALAAGVEDRLVRLAEEHAQIMALALRAAAVDLGMDEHLDYERVLGRHLRALG